MLPPTPPSVATLASWEMLVVPRNHDDGHDLAAIITSSDQALQLLRVLHDSIEPFRCINTTRPPIFFNTLAIQPGFLVVDERGRRPYLKAETGY